MTLIAIMLTSEMDASPHTYPIADKSPSKKVLDQIDSLNSRVRERLDKDEYEADKVGANPVDTHRRSTTENLKQPSAQTGPIQTSD